MVSLWDKQDNESAKQYTAFCDYRDMGTGRSLRLLVDQYVTQTTHKPPARALKTIMGWSSQYNWQVRVSAWDNEQTKLRTEAHETARTRLIEDELRDYRLQLEKWVELFNRTPLHESNYVTTKDGMKTEFVQINHRALHQLTKWREDITKQGRRALGMPEKVTESTVHIETWQDKAIEDIRNDRITFQELESLFDYDLATDLFARAGKSVQISNVPRQS